MGSQGGSTWTQGSRKSDISNASASASVVSIAADNRPDAHCQA